MATPSPLQRVRNEYGDKAKLIEALASQLERPEGESEDDFKQRLKLIPNRKLLRLRDIAKAAADLGGRKGLVKRIVEAKGQVKDHEYADAIAKWPLGRLVDTALSLEARAKRAKAGKAPAKRSRRQSARS